MLFYLLDFVGTVFFIHVCGLALILSTLVFVGLFVWLIYMGGAVRYWLLKVKKYTEHYKLFG